MQESSVYQHWLETTGKERYQEGIQEGKELGARQAIIEALYGVLEHKFDSFAVRMLITSLVEIKDIEMLKQLHSTALEVHEFDDFIKKWKTFESGQ